MPSGFSFLEAWKLEQLSNWRSILIFICLRTTDKKIDFGFYKSISILTVITFKRQAETPPSDYLLFYLMGETLPQKYHACKPPGCTQACVASVHIRFSLQCVSNGIIAEWYKNDATTDDYTFREWNFE